MVIDILLSVQFQFLAHLITYFQNFIFIAFLVFNF